jgi:beta-glucosidase
VSKNQVVNYTLNVKNDGPLAGEETVMLFVQGPPAGFTGKRSVKELKSFAKVSLAAGQTTTVTLQLRVQDLRHWEGNTSGKWVVDNGTYTIMVGPNASEAALNLRTQLEVHD